MFLVALVSMLALPAVAGDDSLRERLERKADRRSGRAEVAQDRWVSACELVDDADPRTSRLADRAQKSLVGARYRHVCVARVLDAWDRPEGEIRVFYATNRARAEGGVTAYRSGDSDRIEYGVAMVRVPPGRAVGAIDRVDIRAIEPLSEESFLASVRDALDAAGPYAQLVTYVHGYNNSFDYAARRTAQIADDVGTPVVPVMYAWPSNGGTWFAGAKYTWDENEAARSSSMLSDVLGGMLSGTAGAPMTLVAHSMGSRLEIDGRPLREIVLAAPDLDAAVFERRYLDVSLQAASRLTVYCATDDRALKFSRSVHGGYDRLGSCHPETMQALGRERLEIVDASNLYADIVDHDKVADSPQLLADLGAVLRGVPAADPGRGLVAEGDHWELPP